VPIRDRATPEAVAASLSAQLKLLFGDGTARSFAHARAWADLRGRRSQTGRGTRITRFKRPAHDVSWYWTCSRGEAGDDACQDFARLAIACLRSHGLAARYVSGYLETLPPPDVPRLAGVDASHAWLAIYCPGLGWVDVDPTNNIFPSTSHVTLAWGRDYADVSPVRGVILGGGQHTLHVSVGVLRT